MLVYIVFKMSVSVFLCKVSAVSILVPEGLRVKILSNIQNSAYGIRLKTRSEDRFLKEQYQSYIQK